MSMRTMVHGGWLLIAGGVAMVAGGVLVAGSGFVVTVLLIGGGLLCVTSGSYLAWLGSGWDTPLGSDEEIHEYGRPASAEVRSVENVRLDGAGTRTAKISVHVSPVNETAFETTRTVVVPGGRAPAVGEAVTVKFDPHRRKNFVLLEQSFEVRDQINRAADVYFGGLQR